ncbi:MAG TPA: thioesterase family protein [Candidatus Binatia bacterium]
MRSSKPSTSNVTTYRVIYGDTDQMGVVYYANYLRWFERGRGELLRSSGIPYTTIERRGMHFPVAELSCRYFRPAHYDDLIVIDTRITSVNRASLTFTYRITRETEALLLLASGSTKHACVDGQGRIMRIQDDLLKALEVMLCRAEKTA